MQRCKEAAWKRRSNEYLTSLHEKHSLKHNKREPEVKVREVVAIKAINQTRHSENSES